MEYLCNFMNVVKTLHASNILYNLGPVLDNFVNIYKLRENHVDLDLNKTADKVRILKWKQR